MAADVDLAQQSLPARPPALAAERASPVADAGPTLQQQAGNQAMQRNAASTALASAPAPAVNLDLDPIRPWFVPVPPHTQPDDVKTLLYGEKGGELQPAIFPGSDLFQVSQGYIIQPQSLVPGRRAEYETLISVRQALLDVELASDIALIKEILDMPDMIRHTHEDKVISKLWRWAHEPFRTKPPRNLREMYTSQYLDNLLLKLGMATKDVGWIATSWTSYYDMLFNRMDRSDEVEQIRDGYSRDFVGEKPMHETKFFGTGKDDFFGMFWEDVKSGEVADRIGNYFLGMLDAGEGLLEGLYTLITDPKKAIEGLLNLPHNLSVMWKNRDKIWNEFVNAPPDQQARMIGRIFGEAEILIATFEAGGGPKAPAPGLAVAEEVVPVGGNAAALTMGGGAAIPLNLGKLGTEATRVTALMSTATEAGQKGDQQAQSLNSEEASSKPTAEEKPAVEEKTKVEDKPPVKEKSPAVEKGEPLKEPPKPEFKAVSHEQYEKMSFADRKALVDEWMTEHGVTRIVKSNEQHAWPKYLGGPEDGPLISFDEQLHTAYHSGLDKLLRRGKGTEYFASLSKAEQAQNLRTLVQYTKDFDMDYGTRISEVLAKALKGVTF